MGGGLQGPVWDKRLLDLRSPWRYFNSTVLEPSADLGRFTLFGKNLDPNVTLIQNDHSPKLKVQ